VHAGKLGQVSFTIVGGTAKHCIDSVNGFVSLLFSRGETAMPGGGRAT